MNEIISRLKARALSLAGAHASDGHKTINFNLLDESSLDIFVEFPMAPESPLLMRCTNADRERLTAQAPGIHVSTDMKWGGDNWKWTDVPVDGSLPEPILAELIDRSYQIVAAGLNELGKLKLDLISRKLPPAQVLEELISQCGFSGREAEIRGLVRPAFLLKTRTSHDNDVPLGHSKIGGTPDLPATISWPVFSNGKPLAFLAQINLAQIPSSEDRVGLPQSGMLYLFSVYGWQSPDDSDPHLPGGAYAPSWTRILYHKEASALTRRQPPSALTAFDCAPVDMLPILSLPTSGDEPVVASLNLGEDERDRYESFVSVFTTVCDYALGRPARHLLLGFADYVQFCVEEVAAGYLQLLFQIASDDNTGMCWGDGGNLYFWLPPADLECLDFESVYTDYQCG